MTTATLTQEIRVNTAEYLATQRDGTTREVLVRNLTESNFQGLRRLSQYTKAGDQNQTARAAFCRDLARGNTIQSYPFPFEVALLRALQMGLNRWDGAGDTLQAQAQAFIGTLRCGVLAPHLPSVVEYEPEIFFRAFQGVEVHRDVTFMEGSELGAEAPRVLDWMDYRIYQVPGLEKDLLWDLFNMSKSPWSSKARKADKLNGGEVTGSSLLPYMVGRQRNREEVPGGSAVMLTMSAPGASLHLSLVTGSPLGIKSAVPAMVGERLTVTVPSDDKGGAAFLGQTPAEIKDGDHWLIVTYQPPPNLSTGLRLVPAEIRPMEEA